MNVLKLFFVHEKLASAQLRESTKCCQAYKLFHQFNQNCQKAKTNIIKVRGTYKGLGGNFSRFGSELNLFAHAAGLLQKPCFALYKLYIGNKCWQGPATHHTPCAQFKPKFKCRQHLGFQSEKFSKTSIDLVKWLLIFSAQSSHFSKLRRH